MDLHVKQNHSCAICGREAKDIGRLHLDHDHTSGENRGLLCRLCNTGLGRFHDNPVLLNKAALYLSKYLSEKVDQNVV
jgi:hypothetical protein